MALRHHVFLGIALVGCVIPFTTKRLFPEHLWIGRPPVLLPGPTDADEKVAIAEAPPGSAAGRIGVFGPPNPWGEPLDRAVCIVYPANSNS